MAKNIVQQFFHPSVKMNVITPTTDAANGIPASGTPVVATGGIVGIAQDHPGADGYTPVCPECIAELSVKGVGTSGNAAISAGDKLYIQTDGTIDKNSGGSGAIYFGVAYGNSLDPTGSNKTGVNTLTGTLVSSGATTQIRVWVGKSLA